MAMETEPGGEFPEPEEASPESGGAFLEHDDAFPEQGDAFPEEGEAFPEHGDAFPEAHDPSPEHHGAFREPDERRPATGEPRVDAALAKLDELAGRPVTEHRAIFEDVHRRLREVLGELDTRQPSPARDATGAVSRPGR
jgi:hypothetical protein